MKKLKVSLHRSTIGTTERQKATVKGLGLRKVGDVRVLDNTPAIRGMIRRVLHLVDASEIDTELELG